MVERRSWTILVGPDGGGETVLMVERRSWTILVGPDGGETVLDDPGRS